MPEVESIRHGAFFNCTLLRRIAIPSGIIASYYKFNWCENLSTVDSVGGIHKTISSLHMESWRNDIHAEIDRINSDLEDTPANHKTRAIEQWIESILERLNHYKTEHKALLKEAMTLLELALWKAKLEENGSNMDAESNSIVRKRHRVTCGANIVIKKNVLPFLVLKEYLIPVN